MNSYQQIDVDRLSPEDRETLRRITAEQALPPLSSDDQASLDELAQESHRRRQEQVKEAIVESIAEGDRDMSNEPPTWVQPPAIPAPRVPTSWVEEGAELTSAASREVAREAEDVRENTPFSQEEVENLIRGDFDQIPGHELFKPIRTLLPGAMFKIANALIPFANENGEMEINFDDDESMEALLEALDKVVMRGAFSVQRYIEWYQEHGLQAHIELCSAYVLRVGEALSSGVK